MKFETYADQEMMAIDVANVIASDLSAALQHEDRILFAVAGGTTPGPIFDDLCAADVDWSRVDVIATDERWVPETHPRSNTAMIRERLMVNRAAKARLLPLYAAAHEPEEVLAELESMIAPELPIAVAMMGMGTDMHTASLFPGAEGLGAALDPHAPILVPVRPKDQPESRITMSARVLNETVSKHIIITGTDKRHAIESAARLEVAQAPIRAVMNDAIVHWAE